MIEKILCNLTKNEEAYQNIKSLYKHALNENHFLYNLTYKHKKRKKKHLI